MKFPLRGRREGLLRCTLCTLSFLLTLGSCAVGPDFKQPDAPQASGYNAGGDPAKTIAAAGLEQHFATGGVPAQWWKMFGSPDLNKIMDEAFANSPTVQAAQAALRMSRDNLQAGQGVFYPQIDAGGDAARQKLLPQQFGSSAAGSIFNLFTLAGTVSYTLDIFGGERRQVEALSAQVDYQKANLQATYLTLSGNLVNTVIARAAYNAEIEDTQKIIDLEKEQVASTQAQYKAGTIPYSNVLSLQTQLSATEATLPALKQSLTQTENLLAQLCGRLPVSGIPTFASLSGLRLPTELPVTLPSELAHKRPDIIAAEAQLHAASAQIGVATAAMYPDFTLSGSYGTGSMTAGSLFSPASAFWNLGSHLTAPIFHGGTLSAQQQAAKDAYDQAGATYKSVVLAAFSQVANTLHALEHDAQALQAQSHALDTAEENFHLVQANYKAGLVNYVQVLVADIQYLQAKIGYTQATAQRLQDTVALYVALGGGWREKH